MDAEALELYRWSVQDPQRQAAVLTLIYHHLRRRRPLVLREDFAGTAADSMAWVGMQTDRRAIAVERDAGTLEWARREARERLGSQADRLEFIHADVLEGKATACQNVDVVAALNFSICFLRHRNDLLTYLVHARKCLRVDGLLVTNLFGGPGAMRAGTQKRTVTPTSDVETTPGSFIYEWEQSDYEPLDRSICCRIHFHLDGGERLLSDAFVYHWRLWTLAEIRELMKEAGFTDVQVWRHYQQESSVEAHPFLGPIQTLRNLEYWVVYVVGIP